MWLNPTAFWRSCGNGSLKQLLSIEPNSGNPFVGSVMAGILAPVTASRTKFDWHNVRSGHSQPNRAARPMSAIPPIATAACNAKSTSCRSTRRLIRHEIIVAAQRLLDSERGTRRRISIGSRRSCAPSGRSHDRGGADSVMFHFR
jgi:hypothetical protein